MKNKYIKWTIDDEYDSEWLLRSRFNGTSIHKYNSTVVYNSLAINSKHFEPWLTGNDIDIEHGIFATFVI